MEGKRNKPFYKKAWFWIVVIVVLALGTYIGGENSQETATKTGTVASDQKEDSAENNQSEKKENDAKNSPSGEEDNGDHENSESENNIFVPGDIVETQKVKISFLSAGEYTVENEFLQPKEGSVYYRVEFEFENIGDTDETISSILGFSCYADGYAMDQALVGDDQLDATISPGKKAKGSLYYEVPADAEEIVVEYETNFYSGNKIVFVAK